MKAGVHEIRATFLMKTDAVSEGFRKPFLKPYIGRGTDDERETREGAALRELEIMGPLNPGGAASAPSYQKVFVVPSRRRRPEEPGCAQDDPLDAGAPRLSPAGHRRRHGRC